MLVVAAPLAAGGNGQRGQKHGTKLTQAQLPRIHIEPSLLERAKSTPNALVKILIQSQSGSTTTATQAYETGG